MPSIANLREIMREKLDAEVFKRPPEEWRNLWSTMHELHFTDGRIVGPGEFLGEAVWPSIEVAEAKAAEQVREDHQRLFSSGVIKYVEAWRMS